MSNTQQESSVVEVYVEALQDLTETYDRMSMVTAAKLHRSLKSVKTLEGLLRVVKAVEAMIQQTIAMNRTLTEVSGMESENIYDDPNGSTEPQALDCAAENNYNEALESCAYQLQNIVQKLSCSQKHNSLLGIISENDVATNATAYPESVSSFKTACVSESEYKVRLDNKVLKEISSTSNPRSVKLWLEDASPLKPFPFRGRETAIVATLNPRSHKAGTSAGIKRKEGSSKSHSSSWQTACSSDVYCISNTTKGNNSDEVEDDPVLRNCPLLVKRRKRGELEATKQPNGSVESTQVLPSVDLKEIVKIQEDVILPFSAGDLELQPLRSHENHEIHPRIVPALKAEKQKKKWYKKLFCCCC